MIKDDLIKLITEKAARVGVVGLGYVGLPLVTEFAGAGFAAIGFEVDQSKADRINAGESYIGDIDSATVRKLTESKQLEATTDFNRLRDCDAIIICVPTPLRKTKEPDISYILAAAEEIKQRLRRGQLIILESTTYRAPLTKCCCRCLKRSAAAGFRDFYSRSAEQSRSGLITVSDA
jgi:UDP-N-acetyl-D-glucosamine dehydrogenase